MTTPARDILKKFFKKVSEVLDVDLDEQARQAISSKATGRPGMQYKVAKK